MIKNIILDLAGVVLNLNLERDTQALHDVGLPDYKDCLQCPEIIIPMSAYLSGLLPIEDFLERIRPFCKQEATDDEILWSMDAVLDDIPQSRLARIAELRKKYRVYLLSNIYEAAWNHTLLQMEKHGYVPNDCFDQLFLSYEIKLAKPNPLIFHHLFQETGLNPEETVYFDDTEENVRIGSELGLHTCFVPMNKLEDCLDQWKL